MIRFAPSFLSNLDMWIAEQDDQPSRPEAIRRLIGQALVNRPK